MNIFITGGTGFIGTELSRRLLERGDQVTVICRNPGKLAASLLGKIRVVEADLREPAALRNLASDTPRIDALIHLAASLDYYGDKGRLFKANVEGTENVLAFAESRKVGKLIYASSIEAMGLVAEADVPADETYVPRPSSSYGESKLAAERKVLAYSAGNRGTALVLRLGNVYGPPSPSFILPIAKAIAGKGRLLRYLPAYGDRYVQPVYIDDVVGGILKAMDRAPAGQCYILAGKEFVTVKGLFKVVGEAVSSGVDLDALPSGPLDGVYLKARNLYSRFRKRADLLTYFSSGNGKRVHRAYSIAKAGREFGWYPAVGLAEGVKRTLEAGGRRE